MDKETLLSAGIDIGTTTTHLIISEISITVQNSFSTVPKAEITDKKILYKSPVYYTPLNDKGLIDPKAVADMIESEYKRAGIKKEELKSGAVIITGESAKKRNAGRVLQELSLSSGRFVTASAGAELESFLSGKGAGADLISKETGRVTANADIGGGTTNISVFKNGELVDDCCLNIGGRLVRFDNGKLQIAGCIKPLCSGMDLNQADGLNALCAKMAGIIKAALLSEHIKIEKNLITDHLLSGNYIPEIITFSGGVAECMRAEYEPFQFGDIGVLLAGAVSGAFADFKGEIKSAGNNDPIRATVIGAGNFSVEISGSTIQFSGIDFPLRNLECVKDLSRIGNRPCAICPESERAPGFDFVNALAADIAGSCSGLIASGIPIVVITENDFSKALGICLKKYLPENYPFICLDGIQCSRGDYIDIGMPVAGGRAVPVVVKTLVFGG